MRSAPALLALLLAAPPAFAKAPSWLNGGDDPWIELEREAAAYRARQPAPPPPSARPAPPAVDDSPPAPPRARVTDLPPDDPYYEPFDDPMTAPLDDPMGGLLPDGRVTARPDAPEVEPCPMVPRDDLAAAIAEERAKLAEAAAVMEDEADRFAAEADAIAAELEAEAEALDRHLDAPAQDAPGPAAELGPPPVDVEPPTPRADPNDDPAPWLDERLDPTQPDLTRVALAIVEATNVAREAHGLRPVKAHPALNAAASGHARRMAELGFFAHEDPHDGARRTPTDRARLAGVRNPQIAENIATQLTLDQTGDGPLWDAKGGFATSPRGAALPAHTYRSFARRVVQRWLDSPGHRANLLAKAGRQMGAGAAYFEQEGGVPTLTAVQVFQWHQPVRTRTLPRRTVTRR